MPWFRGNVSDYLNNLNWRKEKSCAPHSVPLYKLLLFAMPTEKRVGLNKLEPLVLPEDLTGQRRLQAHLHNHVIDKFHVYSKMLVNNPVPPRVAWTNNATKIIENQASPKIQAKSSHDTGTRK